MICSHCKKNIPDGVHTCPECGSGVSPPENGKKNAQREYTHYRVVLSDPGTRSGTAGLLADITGLSAKEVANRLRNMPWILATGIPLKRAQEIKILLETSRAVVTVEGIDIWDDETVVEVPAPAKGKKRRIPLTLVVLLLGVSAATVFVYIIVTMNITGRQSLLGKLHPAPSRQIADESAPQSVRGQHGDAPGTEESKKTGEETSGIRLPLSKQPQDYNLHDEGINPFSAEIAIVFVLEREEPVTLMLFDHTLRPVSTLLTGTLSPETYTLRWHGMKDERIPAGSGLYIVRLTTPTGRAYHKIVWLSPGQ